MKRQKRGKLLIFSAPSGSGKSTIIGWLMEHHPELKLAFSISCTSREPRGTEQNGVEYFFLTADEFRAKIDAGEFLEYEEVYENCFYGTLMAQVERQLKAGQNVVFDVDVKGGVNIKKYYGDKALSIFIQPPSVEELRRRLIARKTDSEEMIAQRVAKAEYELTFAPQFDRILVNDDLQTALNEAYTLVAGFVGELFYPINKNSLAIVRNHKKRIGIYGGTFNPIHVGHLQIASTVIERGIVDEVWLMISPLNPFKQGTDDILPDADRLLLATKALDGNERIKASDYEFHLPIPSYTWNTLQHLSREFTDCEFVLVIGADNWTSFPRWKNYQDIIANYQIVVYPRNGHDIDAATLPQGVTLIDMPLINVSSTDIRQRIAHRRSIKKLVPPAIIDDCKRLYRQNKNVNDNDNVNQES